MKKFFLVVFVMVMATGLCRQVVAGNGKSDSGDIITAIDVANMLRNGSSYTDISKLLSDKLGFDRTSALKKGKTDQMIVEDLVFQVNNSKKVVDKNKVIIHKAEGDKYFNNSQYDKAAKEYSLAINYSSDNYQPYKLRGDSYKQLIVAERKSVFKNYSTQGKQELYNKSKTLLCYAIRSDYNEASKIISDTMMRNKTSLDSVKYKMEPKNLKNGNGSDIAPNRQNASGSISGMREMDAIYRSQREAYQSNIYIRKAISDYKLICGEQDTTKRELLKTGKNNNGNKK